MQYSSNNTTQLTHAEFRKQIMQVLTAAEELRLAKINKKAEQEKLNKLMNCKK